MSDFLKRMDLNCVDMSRYVISMTPNVHFEVSVGETQSGIPRGTMPELLFIDYHKLHNIKSVGIGKMGPIPKAFPICPICI
jgi:hypothetical protein